MITTVMACRRRTDGITLALLSIAAIVSAPSSLSADALPALYWTTAGSNVDPQPRIQRAGADGGQVETLVTAGLVEPSAIAVDLAAGKLYWTDLTTATIGRVELNGDNAETVLVTAVGERVDLAVDAAGDVVDYHTGVIYLP